MQLLERISPITSICCGDVGQRGFSESLRHLQTSRHRAQKFLLEEILHVRISAEYKNRVNVLNFIF